MKTRFLLPHLFKKWGSYMAPLGFLGWLIGQQLHPAKEIKIFVTIFLLITFCSFAVGTALLVFSREKREDEYTQQVRMESYQFSSLVQFLLLFIIIILVIVNELIYRGDNNFDQHILEKAPFFLVFLFWVVYFIRFNYILHFSKNNSETD